LILAVAVLGGLAAAISFLMAGSSTHQSNQGLPLPAANTPRGAAADIQGAAIATCRVDYQEVQTAVDAYEAMNGRPPASLAQLGTILQDPLSSSRFTITINEAHPGQIEVAAAGHPPEPGPANCAYAG
jgi:hypothetical protein